MAIFLMHSPKARCSSTSLEVARKISSHCAVQCRQMRLPGAGLPFTERNAADFQFAQRCWSNGNPPEGKGRGWVGWRGLTPEDQRTTVLRMYRIIGADEHEYGPATAEQLRQWIAEGKANADTKVRVEGATEWTKLSELPEFFPKVTLSPKPTFAPAPFPTAPVPRNNPLAVASLVLGVLSLTFACCC